jgi:hypothetical protein
MTSGFSVIKMGVKCLEKYFRGRILKAAQKEMLMQNASLIDSILLQ